MGVLHETLGSLRGFAKSLYSGCFMKPLYRWGFAKPCYTHTCTHMHVSVFSYRYSGCFTNTLYRGSIMKPLGALLGFAMTEHRGSLHTHTYSRRHSATFFLQIWAIHKAPIEGLEKDHRALIQRGLCTHTYT